MIVTVGTTVAFPGACECAQWSGDAPCRLLGHRVLVERSHPITGSTLRLLVMGPCARRLAPVRAAIGVMGRMAHAARAGYQVPAGEATSHSSTSRRTYAAIEDRRGLRA